MKTSTRSKVLPILLSLAALGVTVASTARATPSTQIWIPSTDVQPFAVVHLNSDVYANHARAAMLVLGPTIGVIPWDKLQAEVGFDLMLSGVETLDDHPLYFHAKLGTPEGSIFKLSPALAAGIYNVGTKPGLTMQNVGYVLVARTLPYLGRLSFGYFLGNAAILRKPLPDGTSTPDNHGFLASWDRQVTELTDKLWLCVDFQSTDSALGALSGGFAWAFSKNVSVIVGYDHYWNEATAGKDTFTIQFDINL